MAPQRVAPSSLFDAHEELWRRRPSHDAAPAEWMAFHRRSAEVYAAAAKVDVPNRGEASQYAAFAIRRAREIEHRLALTLDCEA
ncbi:AMED_5909 family protein [Actinophytocola sp. NPDC049390]|uniref:AMED_5909 family protein n=1 Tax=Actinophytocola sp. NPDC049390 TaxID=3363894 RepID=UPI00378B51E3